MNKLIVDIFKRIESSFYVLFGVFKDMFKAVGPFAQNSHNRRVPWCKLLFFDLCLVERLDGGRNLLPQTILFSVSHLCNSLLSLSPGIVHLWKYLALFHTYLFLGSVVQNVIKSPTDDLLIDLLVPGIIKALSLVKATDNFLICFLLRDPEQVFIKLGKFLENGSLSGI